MITRYRCALVVATVAPLAHAGNGPINYLDVQQYSYGRVVTSVDFEPGQADSYTIENFSPANLDEAFSLTTNPANEFDTITMEATYQSTFSSSGFSIETISTANILNPEAYGGTFLSGSVDAELALSVTFEVTRNTQVEYFIGSELNYTGFISLDSDTEFEHYFAGDQNIFDLGTSGSMLLTPGTYQMFAEGYIDESSERRRGGFTLVGTDSISGYLTLNVVPAPGAAAWLLGGGLLATRRRR